MGQFRVYLAPKFENRVKNEPKRETTRFGDCRHIIQNPRVIIEIHQLQTYL